jgi:RNA chaperone Hfq
MDLTHSLKDSYIDDLIQHQAFSSIYLKNGIRLKGRLIGHDETCVFLKAAETQTIYKNRISTITPERSFSRFQQKEEKV